MLSVRASPGVSKDEMKTAEVLPEAADIMWSEQEGKCPAGPEHLQKRDECQQQLHLEDLRET